MAVFLITDLTPEQFQMRLEQHRTRFPLPDILAYAQRMMLGGNEEAIQAFTRSPFLRIQTFAGLARVSRSTVRHYTNLGLLIVYRVNGKHYYDEHSFGLLRKIQQWRSLGLSLAEVAELFQQEQQAGKTLLSALTEYAAPFEPAGVPQEFSGILPSQAAVSQLIHEPVNRQRLNADSRMHAIKTQHHQALTALRHKLEDRKAVVEQQLARLTELESQS